MGPRRHGHGGKRGHKKQNRPAKKRKTENNKRSLPQKPAETREAAKQILESSSSESEEEINDYQKLMFSIKTSGGGATESGDEEDDEKDDADGDKSDESEDDNTSDDESDEENEDKEMDSNIVNGKKKETTTQIEEEVEVMESDEDEEHYQMKESDPFSIHFENEKEEDFITNLEKKESWKKSNIKVPHVGSASLTASTHQSKISSTDRDLKKQYVKSKLCTQVFETNKSRCNVDRDLGDYPLNGFQENLFSIINNYQDLYLPNRTLPNGEQIRLVYCLHALNHVLKTRSRVIAHNTKLKKRDNDQTDSSDYRDQGLTRPKVLIVLPFRESALRVIEMMTSLLMPKDQKHVVGNKKRFQSEYTEMDKDIKKPPNKPAEYDEIFAGNIDDHFRLGMGVAKNTLKLYTPFYASDIILASPLGLRTVIGAEGDRERDYDFLNSIEILIFDQADIFLMQNWDHITHLMKHLHLQPSEAHGVDFSRVRMWTVNGWSKFYRQTLMFSSVAAPQINAIFNRHCSNYAGKVMVTRPDTSGAICQIVTQLPQTYHKIKTSSYASAADDRFEFFIKKILPQQKEALKAQTVLFIPSYFDFVRLRNHFVREDLDFSQICEYSSDKNNSRSRSYFFHGNAHFLLYTERAHFFKRFKVRGIHHIVFYELPTYPHYYSELCNMIQDLRSLKEGDTCTCTALYTQYDAQKLADIVGTNRTSIMINSTKTTHMFVTGDNT
ncbi:digestive organ expansion factor homolog isoform X2 [Mizuhopecten yessoensis]|uniref:digestive organ expansion factor homolog isoform X2 n=1 Tax=Mizuhopecten yessoensis TaxID=6573 RepID=UPI000B45D4F0|nr:digestive organ expansion factor homolog isoform X2 [Mizuhopecten yessoensis]